MMSDGVFLGIDTSNYTTSAALVSKSGELIANIKRPLPVKLGERGLRQSDAVFAHVKNFPSAMEELRLALGGRRILALGVSSAPRRCEGSYMPCFLSGVAVAEGIGAALGVPLYRYSHQCGHIMAALYSSGREELRYGDFLAFHISGGTTEMLRVKGEREGFATEIVGATKDISAGQLIDRVGVYLGLPFPAGARMEALAKEYTGKVKKKKPSFDNGYINLSGIENTALRQYAETSDKNAVAAFVIEHIGDCILTMALDYRQRFGDIPAVFAGGVMSCSLIKEKLLRALPDSYYAAPPLSADNAVGIACLARESYS